MRRLPVVPAALSLVALLAASLAAPGPAGAQWTTDPSTDVIVCDATNGQSEPVSAPDGSGGSVIAWLDYRGSVRSVYAQRLDANGVPLWTEDGILVADAASALDLAISADGAGGAFITWADNRGGIPGFEIYLQHVDPNGTPQWVEDGVPVISANWEQRRPAVLADGTGGAYVAWDDYRNSSFYRIFMQRVDATGALQWATGGVVASALTAWSQLPQLIPDGAGGVLVGWQTGDLRVSRLDANGSHQWASAGIVVATGMGTYYAWNIVPDGTGGFLAAYRKNDRVYGARVDGTGTPLWTDVPVGIAGDAYDLTAVEDGAGGLFAAWMDNRNGLPLEIRAQRIDGAGVVQWLTDGVYLGPGTTATPGICGDGTGGVIVGWHSAAANSFLVQRIAANGTELWTSGGVAMSQSSPSYVEIVAHTDGAGGAIVAYRAGPSTGDIYAERIDADGNLGSPVDAPVVAGVVEAGFAAYPNPFRRSTTLELAADGRRAGTDSRIDILDVAGRRVRSLPARTLGDKVTAEWDGRDEAGAMTPAGIYFVREATSGATGRVMHLR